MVVKAGWLVARGGVVLLWLSMRGPLVLNIVVSEISRGLFTF